MGSTALVGITDLVAGEKDPRNLMIIFSVLKVIMVEWDVSEHAEVRSNTVGSFERLTLNHLLPDPVRIRFLLLSNYIQAEAG